MTGIYSVEVSYNEQKVSVWGICNKYDVLHTIRNKRKQAEFWNPEDNLMLLQQIDAQQQEEEPSLSSQTKGQSLIRWKYLKKVFG